MRRLVYAPKAYAWVDTEKHGLYDLTPYLIRGSVNRLVNAPSTAELEFRNPNMMFTETARTAEGPYFRPMDRITIWLERIRGYPVQVFTGYIDTAPYLQIYPGPCTITASCTLKRLHHMYWDMGLNYTSNWLAKYGWEGSKSTGQLLNATAEKEEEAALHTQLGDGSIGELLFATLTEIADWPKDGIHIEELPPDLIAKVTNIWTAYSEDSEEIAKGIEKMVKKYIGEGNLATGSLNGGGPGGGSKAPINIDEVEKYNHIYPAHFIENTEGKAFLHEMEIRAIFEACGESPRRAYTYFTIARGEGGGGKMGAYPGIVQHDPGDGNVGYGIVQNTPHAWGGGPAYAYMEKLGGINALRNPVVSAMVAIKLNELSGNNFEPWGGGGSSNNRSRYLDENPPSNIESALDRVGNGGRAKGDDADPDKVVTGGKLKNNSDSAVDDPKSSKWTYPLEKKGTFMGGVAAHHARAFGNWMSDDAVDLGVPPGTRAVAVEDATVSRISIDPSYDPGANPNGSTVYISGKSGNEHAYMHLTEVKCNTNQKLKAGDVIGLTGTANGVDHLHFASTPVNPETVIGEGNVTDVPGSPGSGGGGGTGGADWEDVMSTAKAAAFVQELQFPGLMESFESNALTGVRSLLNDKPLYPFIEQLSQAAMRSFQSLPNGDFYAFYPDYFGTIGNRRPYWEIDDIEILDGQIALNDEALKTHVYAVGDTMPFTPGIDRFERTTNTGIVNIFNKAQSGFTGAATEKEQIDREEVIREQHRKTVVSDPTECVRFLQKYGARPHLEEATFVRSRFYEAFLAWTLFDLMWSRQFLTDFTLTFMPEIFPGGLVSFPTHSVQCYVDQVTHNFDYEGGFTTTASLSAPATLSSEELQSDPLSFGLVRAGAEQ